MRIEGVTRADLEGNIGSYRIRNGRAPGDITSEVDSYYCSKWPEFCIPDEHDIQPVFPQHVHLASVPGAQTINARVTFWAARQIQMVPPGGHRLVPQSKANARAEVCAACPRNIKWRAGCGSCSATTESILTAIRRLNKTHKDKELFACDMTGTDNKTTVWFADELVKLSQAERNAAPSNCWRLQI